MTSLTEQEQRFEFPSDWEVRKFDEWSFYRNQFHKLASAHINCSSCEKEVRCANCNSPRVTGTKGIDFLAVESDAICWHIEVKDYRLTRESSFEFLADEVALKVRDTLACLMVAKVNANDAQEKRIAQRAVKCSRYRVVLHLEQPVPHSRLDSKSLRSARVLQRMKQLLKPIDTRPLIVEQTTVSQVPWNVADV